MTTKKTLTNVELEFMHIIWEHEPVATEKIQHELSSQGRTITDGGIRRILSILMKKGFLSRTKDGRAFLYRSKVKHEEAAKNMLGYVREKVFKGSVPSMVATLLGMLKGPVFLMGYWINVVIVLSYSTPSTLT